MPQHCVKCSSFVSRHISFFVFQLQSSLDGGGKPTHTQLVFRSNKLFAMCNLIRFGVYFFLPSATIRVLMHGAAEL